MPKCTELGVLTPAIKPPKPPKVNYHVGNNHDLLELLLLFGVVPYDSLNYLLDDPRFLQRAATKMRDDGTILKGKRGQRKCLWLATDKEQAQKWEIYVSEELKRYYQSESSDRRNRTSGDNVNSIKTVSDIDAQMFLYACGYKTGPHAKDATREPWGRSEESYYTSKEFKRISAYRPNKIQGKKSTDAKMSSSRANGVLVTGGGNYVVYNLERDLISWARSTEMKMGVYATQTIRSHSSVEYPPRMETNAVVLASSNNPFYKMVMLEYGLEKQQNKVATPFINVDHSYDHMYAVTKDNLGKTLLRMMGTPAWKETIENNLLSQELIDGRMSARFPCDGYDPETGIHYLLFCIPDIVKLKTFVTWASLEQDKKKFRIYCFKHQVPLIIALTNDGKDVSILKADIEDCYREWFLKRGE